MVMVTVIQFSLKHLHTPIAITFLQFFLLFQLLFSPLSSILHHTTPHHTIPLYQPNQNPCYHIILYYILSHPCHPSPSPISPHPTISRIILYPILSLPSPPSPSSPHPTISHIILYHIISYHILAINQY